jgi:vacuolar-type H+-ATPase subunit H
VADLGKAEILREIKTAEEKVRSMIAEAEERRKQLQADGKRIALQRTEAAHKELRQQTDSKIAVAQARIDEQKKRLLEEGHARADAVASAARKKMGDAKEFVLSEFERAADA